MAVKSFTESISSWASATPKRIEAVHKRSLEKLVVEMSRTKAEGGKVPFQTGNLYRSIVADTSSMPRQTNSPATGSNATAVIARLKPNQQLFIGYTANYARRMNFGFIGADSLGRVYNQEGNHFLERAIAMWGQLVKEAVNEVKSANS